MAATHEFDARRLVAAQRRPRRQGPLAREAQGRGLPASKSNKKGTVDLLPLPLPLPPAVTAQQAAQMPLAVAQPELSTAPIAYAPAVKPPPPPWALSTTMAPSTPKTGGVQWASSMGRSKKSRDVEAKNYLATIEYQKKLAAHNKAQEEANKKAAEMQQQVTGMSGMAQLLQEAAAGLVSFLHTTRPQADQMVPPGATPHHCIANLCTTLDNINRVPLASCPCSRTTIHRRTTMSHTNQGNSCTAQAVCHCHCKPRHCTSSYRTTLKTHRNSPCNAYSRVRFQSHRRRQERTRRWSFAMYCMTTDVPPASSSPPSIGIKVAAAGGRASSAGRPS